MPPPFKTLSLFPFPKKLIKIHQIKIAMKRRVGINGGAPPADLLLCFPSRVPKPICSPSRAAHHHHRHHHSPRPAHSRPTSNRTKTNLGSDIGSEPTSPKVTCAGQIKVRHHHRKNRDGPKNWLDALGLKRDVMNFLGALRGVRFNMRCFGNLHGAVDCCSDDDDDEEEEGEGQVQQVSSGPHVFSKWFMVLGENQHLQQQEEVKVPPKNALLLMRCRSAPAKGRREEGEEVKGEEKGKDADELRAGLLRGVGGAKETWVVGSVDPLARSRSWRR